MGQFAVAALSERRILFRFQDRRSETAATKIKLTHYRQARGSLSELRDHLTTFVDEGYLGVAEAKQLDALIQSVTRLLNGYLRSTLARKRMETGK